MAGCHRQWHMWFLNLSFFVEVQGSNPAVLVNLFSQLIVDSGLGEALGGQSKHSSRVEYELWEKKKRSDQSVINNGRV